MNLHATPSDQLEFDDPSVANLLFGPRNAHLDLLAGASGAQITSRGASVLVRHENPAVRQRLCNLFVQLYELLRSGESLSQQDIARAYRMLESDPGVQIAQIYRDAVFISTPGRTVTARNVAQKAYLEALRQHEMVFAVGPAGTGKTYLAVAMALSMLAQHRVKRIILTRPAVEAGERLGFLPGELAEKVNP